MAMIRVSLEAWLTRGDLGPFRVGVTKAELLRVVGHPDLAGCADGGEDAVWKYGDIELLFDVGRAPAVVWCVEMHAFDGAPEGGRRVRVDPWIVRSELPLATMLAALDRLAVAHRSEVPKYGRGLLNVILRDDPKLHLDFITSDADGWPIGLHGVWMTRV
jgi:hypothetical protein